jgi:hypothetical protein
MNSVANYRVMPTLALRPMSPANFFVMPIYTLPGSPFRKAIRNE